MGRAMEDIKSTWHRLDPEDPETWPPASYEWEGTQYSEFVVVGTSFKGATKCAIARFCYPCSDDVEDYNAAWDVIDTEASELIPWRSYFTTKRSFCGELYNLDYYEYWTEFPEFPDPPEV